MLLELLRLHGIPYEIVDHAPVFTCEEARRITPELPGAETKNLFLCDGKGRRHFLVAVPPEKRVDLKKLGSLLDVNGLRLASSERLAKYLGLTAGAVTLVGVINDPNGLVEVVIDEDLWSEQVLQCHPLVNTSTLALSREALTKFFEVTDHAPRVVDIPVRL